MRPSPGKWKKNTACAQPPRPTALSPRPFWRGDNTVYLLREELDERTNERNTWKRGTLWTKVQKFRFYPGNTLTSCIISMRHPEDSLFGPAIVWEASRGKGQILAGGLSNMQGSWEPWILMPLLILCNFFFFETLHALASLTKDLTEIFHRTNISRGNNCKALYENNC